MTTKVSSVGDDGTSDIVNSLAGVLYLFSIVPMAWATYEFVRNGILGAIIQRKDETRVSQF